MSILTPVEISSLADSLFLLLLMGILFFAGSVFLMIVLFGLSTKETLKNAKGVVALLILSLGIPLGVTQIAKPTSFSSQASSEVAISNLEIIPDSSGGIEVTFLTSEPAIAFLEYQFDDKNFIPILPAYKLAKRSNHRITIPESGNKRKEFYIVVDNQRYLVGGWLFHFPESLDRVTFQGIEKFAILWEIKRL